MSSKKQDKTKITAGGQPDPTDGKSNEHTGAMHHVKERDQAKNKDDKRGSGHGEKAAKKDGSKTPGNSIKEAILFLNEVKNEARKITWPPRGQVAQETWSVIVLVTFITVMVLGFDYALGNWVFGPIEHFAKIMAPQTPEQKIFSTTPISPDQSGSAPAPAPAPAPGDASTTPATTPPVAPPPAGTAVPPVIPGDATQPATTPPAATPPVTPAPTGTPTPAPTAPPATPAPTSAPNSAPPTPPHP